MTADPLSTSGHSLTITSPATQHGVILGTAAYMSPEHTAATWAPLDSGLLGRVVLIPLRTVRP